MTFPRKARGQTQTRDILIGLLFAVFLTLPGRAQPISPVNANANPPAPLEERLKSALMRRDMPYRVILPARYASRPDERFPVIYLLHGLSGHYDNWTNLTKLRSYAQSYDLIIVTPEGGDGWYSDSIAVTNDKYESYIVRELMPEIERQFRTLPTREKRAIAGLSMGGYGALKFGLKYPDKFVLAGSFSGALGIASFTEKEDRGAVGKTVDEVFGPVGSEARKANDIFGMVRAMTPTIIKTIPFLYLDCGTEDRFFQDNREFVDLLVERKVPHEFRELPGAHNWKYWDKQVQEILRVADRIFRGGTVAANVK